MEREVSGFSPFIDWPVLQGKGTSISLAWSSQRERSRGWEPAVSSTSLLQRHQDLLGPTGAQPGRGALPSSLEVSQPGRAGKERPLPCEEPVVLCCWSRKGLRGRLKEKILLIYSAPPESSPQNSCLIQIQSKCTHWSHRNITYRFSMLES